MEISKEMLKNFEIPSMSEEDLEQARLTYNRVYGLDIMCLGTEMQRILVNFQKEGAAGAMMDLIYTLKVRQDIKANLSARPLLQPQEAFTEYEDNREYNF